MVMVTGGSTNAVLHLIAMSRSVQDPNVAITLDDFQRISNEVSAAAAAVVVVRVRCVVGSEELPVLERYKAHLVSFFRLFVSLFLFRLHSWPT
jgi:D-arabinose 5-phosphate isomerase GutQ